MCQPSWRMLFIPGHSGEVSWRMLYIPGHSGEVSWRILFIPGHSGEVSWRMLSIPGTLLVKTGSLVMGEGKVKRRKDALSEKISFR